MAVVEVKKRFQCNQCWAKRRHVIIHYASISTFHCNFVDILHKFTCCIIGNLHYTRPMDSLRHHRISTTPSMLAKETLLGSQLERGSEIDLIILVGKGVA